MKRVLKYPAKLNLFIEMLQRMLSVMSFMAFMVFRLKNYTLYLAQLICCSNHHYKQHKAFTHLSNASIYISILGSMTMKLVDVFISCLFEGTSLDQHHFHHILLRY